MFSVHFRRLLVLLLVLTLLLPGTRTVHAANLTVTKTADTNDGVCDADCSLREAIAAAAPGDTITVPANTNAYTLTISHLFINKNLTINGSGVGNTIIEQTNPNFRVIDIGNPGGTPPVVTINKLTVTGGHAIIPSNSEALPGHIHGGGIHNHGTLTLTNVTITGNEAQPDGGGGFWNAGTATLVNVTIAQNSAPTGLGGGIGGAPMTLTNTIVANNTGGNCTATMTITGSNNLQFPGTTCAGAITTADPMLGPLTNGVYPLLPGSQAIDMGTNSGCPPTDQLGTARPQGAACDIGAYEAVTDLTISKSHTGNFTQGQTGAQYTITVSNAGTAPSSGTVTVVDTLPAGLTATALSGTSWNCDLGTLTCTRSDALTAGNSYPNIILTVNVASNAPSSVTNSASVSGGGDQNSSNNTATDPTTINPVSAAPMCNGQTATIYVDNLGMIVGGPNNGQPYAGHLNGTAGADVIVGTNGRDEVSARGGNDVVCGGGDNDELEGGGGRDQLFGQGGNDILKGGEGNDGLNGGGGRDQLFGQGGNDVLAGEDGNDTLTGGLGADRFNGGGGTDTATDFTPAQGDTKTGVENF